MDKKDIILTLYGTKKAVTDFSVTLVDHSYDDTQARDYCNNINELELKGDNWIYAAIIKENQKIKFEKPGFTDFEMLGSLDDITIQTVIRNIDHNLLLNALKAKTETFSAVLRNMSKRAARIFIDEYEAMGPIRLISIKEARSQVVEMIRQLERTGKITLPESGQEEKN